MTLPVIFRADRATREVTAIFPTEAATLNAADFTIYAHIGQHGSGSYGWYQRTRPATPFEYTPLLMELRALYGVAHGPGDTAITLRVVKRFTRGYDEARYAQVRALRTIRAEVTQ
jgi:hypothetical protein